MPRIAKITTALTAYLTLSFCVANDSGAEPVSEPIKAVITLENALRNQNVRQAVAAWHWPTAAMVNFRIFDPTDVPATTLKIAKDDARSLRNAYHQSLTRDGFPDLSETVCSTDAAKPYAGMIWYVAQECAAADGSTIHNRVLVSQTGREWKVVGSGVIPPDPRPDRSALLALDAHEMVTAATTQIQTLDVLSLLQTASTAHELQRLNDAALLFYVAKLRHEADQIALPPGNFQQDPLIRDAREKLAEIERSMVLDLLLTRGALATLRRELRAFNPDYSSDYSPSWGYKQRLPSDDAHSAFNAARNEVLDDIASFERWSDDDTSSEAFRVMRACDIDWFALPDCNDAIANAMRTVAESARHLDVNLDAF